MWKHPWGYAEGLTICGGLLLTGIMLQFAVGKVELGRLSYPFGLIAGALFLILLIVLHVASRRAGLLRWLSGQVAAITAVSALLLLVIIMGLTRQLPAYEDVLSEASARHNLSMENPAGRMGFMQMTSAWPFALLFLYMLLILGLVTLRRLSRFRLKDLGFALNHLGLFTALFAAAFGSGDLRRLRMTAPLNSPEWRAVDERNEIVELPLAVELKSFGIDEYPPKLMLMDNSSGAILPPGRPAGVEVEASPAVLELAGWQVEVVKYFPAAAALINSDTTLFAEMEMEGSAAAVYARVRDANGAALREGWVSCGSFMFPPIPLPLSDKVSLIMPDREPRRFSSEVTVYTKGGDRRRALIEVNRPMAIDGWQIYQLSYDQARGRWSRYSVFELVRDPWLPIVYAGIGMMLAGAVFLFLSKPRKE
ncbi:MAG: cytochrome c biogenesis protein ResB [Tannerellaceae bacterium]|jgi:hypothetical protein|nr:cytochrome c biogenesis protein ResB [Tannerellaceae bacterium]